MGSNQRLHFVGALTVGLFLAGCSKQPDVAAPIAPATTPAIPPANPAQARAASEANLQVKDLELQVDAYQKIYKRKPESLEQMVREGFLRALPPAPPGKRYSLDPVTSRVSLVP
jgi:hypothetical protein